MGEHLIYSRFSTRIGEMLAVCSSKGLCRLCLPGESKNRFFDWASKYFDRPVIEEGQSALIKEAERQINQYLEGGRKSFSLQLDLRGTRFQRMVWHVLLQIPYGSALTYKDIAVTLGNPRAARAVGQANNKNPIPIIIPCHRVIRSDGTLTGYAGGMHIKEWLLSLEGIKIGEGK